MSELRKGSEQSWWFAGGRVFYRRDWADGSFLKIEIHWGLLAILVAVFLLSLWQLLS